MLQHIPPGLRNLVILIALIGMAQISLPNAGINPIHLYLFYPDSDFFKPWQLITHMFAHGGIMHFLFNIIALVSFGGIIEYKLGTRKFLTLYFISGLGAVLLHFMSIGYEVYQLTGSVFPNHTGAYPVTLSYGPMLGASGAIYGIMAAFAFFYPNEEMVFLFIPYPIKAKYLVPIILAIDLIFGITNLESDPFAHFAHLGGALAGFLTVRIWFRKWFRSNWR
jgi:rhomboid-like protein